MTSTRRLVLVPLTVLALVGTSLALVVPIGSAKAAGGEGDTVFNAAIAGQLNQSVNSVGVEEDGQVVAGGRFTTPRQRIARFNADGTTDTDFNAVSSGIRQDVQSVAVHSDGTIAVGGDFTTTYGLTSQYLARLNADGTDDTDFNTQVGLALDQPVQAVAVQSDGKVLVAGDFTTPTFGLARFNSDGSPDTAFNSNVAITGTRVNAVAVQDDGAIVVAGNISGPSGNVARFNTDGTSDTSFNSTVSVPFVVSDLVIQDDGQIVVGGNDLARIGSDGSSDAAFNAAVSGVFASGVSSLALQGDGRILVGGYFTSPSTRLSRVNHDGTLDSAFNDNIDDLSFGSLVIVPQMVIVISTL